MTARLAFHGAAGMVTGSCYLLEAAGRRILIDCGMFQGHKSLAALNYRAFPFAPASLDAVLVTHAHIDHSGLLPKLTAERYKGAIYATEETRDLLTYMLPDSAYVQESETARLNERNRRRARDAVKPAYTARDAEACLEQIEPAPMGRWTAVAPGLRARWWNAGHILGSASIEIEAGGAAEKPLRILFSGDVGPDAKLFADAPEGPAGLDVLVAESTYGGVDRIDQSPDNRRAVLAREVADAFAAGGNLLIPAFAVERTQELLFDLLTLMQAGAVPQCPIFVDSPLGIRATEVFARHLPPGEGRAFGASNVRMTMTQAESEEIDGVDRGAIVIAGSGMCDAGRIRRHLKTNLWRPQATVLLVGYQAPGTLGALLSSGPPEVRIHGQEIAVRARIRKIDVYSGHADGPELVRWILARQPVRAGVCLTHGEPERTLALARALGAAGVAADLIHRPALDEVAEISARGRLRLVQAPSRLPPELLGPRDWHNDYAEAVLELGRLARALPDAKAAALMTDIRKLLAARRP